jgi:hypothetical protein
MMIAPALLATLLAVQPGTAAPAAQSASPPPPPPHETIVVTAPRRGKCHIRLADRALSARQFEHHAGEWARLGRALRVVHPPGTDRTCLARIAFRLGRRGVRVFHFVEQAEGR